MQTSSIVGIAAATRLNWHHDLTAILSCRYTPSPTQSGTEFGFDYPWRQHLYHARAARVQRGHSPIGRYVQLERGLARIIDS